MACKRFEQTGVDRSIEQRIGRLRLGGLHSRSVLELADQHIEEVEKDLDADQTAGDVDPDDAPVLLLEVGQAEAALVERIVITAAACVRRRHQVRVERRADLRLTTAARTDLDTHIGDRRLSVVDRVPVVSVVAAQTVGGVHGEGLVLGKLLLATINGGKSNYLSLSSTQ